MTTRVLFNPRAGTANEQALRAALSQIEDASLHIIERSKHTAKMVKEAIEAGCDTIVAAGGDGTINKVIQGLADDFARVRLGIIPFGTGNDFARSINVPPDLNAAIAILAKGITKKIDVVRAKSSEVRYFVNVSAAGFSGLVDEKLTKEMKKSWGPLAYLRSALEALPDLSQYNTHIRFDDEEELKLGLYNIVMANGRFVAGGIPIAPEAKLDDGLLDIVIIPAATMPQLAGLVPQILTGNHLTSDALIFRRARKVKITSQPGMWFNVDGELVGNEPATFKVLPQALEVIIGPEDTPAPSS